MSARTFISLVVAALVLSPAFAAAQQVSIPAVSATSQNGIFSCNQTGSYAMSVGALGATGGTYVPVYDNSVTLNTGYLVYLECVLRPAVDAASHAVTATLTTQELTQFLSGNNNNPAFTGTGNPFFVQNFGLEATNVANNAFNGTLSSVTSNLNSAFQSQITSALARNYAMTTNNPSLALTCPYGSSVASVLNGTTNDVLGGIGAMLNPSCSPYSAYLMAQNQLNSNVGSAQNAWLTQLNWGRGIYPVTNAAGQVVTPGSLVGLLAGQALISGQLTEQNANDIGQMFTNGLIPALASQILNVANNGLAGINTSINGAPSYLQQAAASAGQALQQSIGSTILSILSPILNVEQQYNQTENSIATTLNNAIAQLQGEQNGCWNAIIQDVCNASSTVSVSGSGETCTGTGGTTLHIATSTYTFAQQVINDPNGPIAQAAPLIAQNVSTSNTNLSTIENLITAAQSTDPSTEQTALQQAQTFVGSFNMQKASNAQSDQQTVQSAITTLLTNTLNTWTGYDSTSGANDIAWNGSASNQNGWCNVPATPGGTPSPAQQTTLNAWLAAWQ